MSSLLRTAIHHPVGRHLLALPLAVRRRYFKARAKRSERIFSSIADRIAGDVLLRVPEFKGEFRIGPKSDLFRRIVEQGDYEPTVRGLVSSSLAPDRDVIDVGANIGFFSVFAACQLTTGRVLSAEPGHAAFERLSANVAHNGVEGRVILFNGIVSSENGEGVINTIVGKEEYSSVVALAHPATIGLEVISKRAPMRTLDDLVREHKLVPSVIKIDVEGGEASVLEGARTVLSEYRPSVICEFSKAMLGETWPNVLKIFKECRYRVIDPVVPSLPPGTRDPCDLWCVPLQ